MFIFLFNFSYRHYKIIFFQLRTCGSFAHEHIAILFVVFCSSRRFLITHFLGCSSINVIKTKENQLSIKYHNETVKLCRRYYTQLQPASTHGVSGPKD